MKIRNWTLLITLSGLACFFYFYITPVYLLPAEDAAILFNYAQNLKETGVISYYPGGKPVDGTTDFLFMLLVSGAMHFFDDAYLAALAVSAFSAMLTMFFVFRTLDTRTLSIQYLALFLFFFSQQIWAAVLGYGTIFYAMTLAWVVLSYWRGKFWALCIASSIALLARPDAIIIVLPLLIHKLIAQKGAAGKKAVQLTTLFILPLALYIGFRHWYFGSVLPLSFSVAMNGEDKVWGLFPVQSIHHVKGYALYYIWPGLLGLAVFMIKQKFRFEPGYYILILSMIVLPMLSFLLIRPDLDFAHRYFIAPYMGLLITFTLLIRNHKSIIITIFGLVLLMATAFQSFRQGVRNLNLYHNNVYKIADDLSVLSNGKMATSEAGILPWKSRFKTLDLWGLNSPELNQRLPEREDLSSFNPDIVYLHGSIDNYSLLPYEQISTEKIWTNLIYRTVCILHEQEYVFYLVPFDTRRYKSETPQHEGLLKSFFTWLADQNNETPGNRTDLVAINPKSIHKKDLAAIIEARGGEAFILPVSSISNAE